MIRKPLVTITGLLFVVISCSKSPSDEQKKDTLNPALNVISERDNELNPALVALKFYNWYLKEIYLKKSVESPEVILNKDSVYELDPKAHIRFLNNSGYFSTKFYENEVGVFNSCNEKLKKISSREVEKQGYSPSELVEGDDYLFLTCMIWTMGQGETLNTAKVKSSKIEKDIANVVIAIGDSLSGDFSYSHVTLLKEKDKWKIAKIKADFNENN